MDFLLIGLIAGCVVLALRSMRKEKACGCSGNCAGCRKCAHR